MITVHQATRKAVPLKMCIVGPSGAGKTYTALTFAKELAQGGKILVLDSEKGSASLYSDDFAFDVVELWTRDEKKQPINEPFHPNRYMEVIRYAEEHGYAVLVVDSLSQLWNDAGGFLDLVNKIAKRKWNGNTFSAWSDVDPLYRDFINTLTDARLHIICTMRSKSDTVQEKDEHTGKTVIRKLGTKAVQREGLEFEFTLYCQMDLENTLMVEKTRCKLVRGAVVPMPTGAFMKPIIQWLNSGAPDDLVGAVPISVVAQLAEHHGIEQNGTAQNGTHTDEPQPHTPEQKKLIPDYYLKAVQLGVIEADKTGKTYRRFLSAILGREIKHTSHLTPDEIIRVGYDLSERESAQEPAPAESF